MPLIPMRPLLDYAEKYTFSVAAVPITSFEGLRASLEAARATKSPLILEIDSKSRHLIGDLFLKHLFLASSATYPDIPIVIHQENITNPENFLSAIELGITSVMINGSLTEDGKSETNHAYNVAFTRYIVDIAHTLGISVTGTLGSTYTLEEMSKNPNLVCDFIIETGIDALSITTTQSIHNKQLLFEKIRELKGTLPPCHFVVHGLDVLSVEDVLKIHCRKVTFEEKEPKSIYLLERPIEPDQKSLEKMIQKLGGTNHASRVPIVQLHEMATLYKESYFGKNAKPRPLKNTLPTNHY